VKIAASLKYMVNFEAVELPQNINGSTSFFTELTFYWN